MILMNSEVIAPQFVRMGARFQITDRETSRQQTDYALDIKADRRGQFFELSIPASQKNSLDLAVLQTLPAERHLVLL